MTSLRRIDLFKIVKCMIYISLTVLGYYFITEGEVLQRYRDRKTNFAEYSEPISELPAIVTWIEDSEHRQTDLKLHRHYKLIYDTSVTHNAHAAVEVILLTERVASLLLCRSPA